MSFIGNLFGSKGMGWQAQGAPIEAPVTGEQATNAYGQVQQGLGNQAQFLQALQAQGGLGNQSNVFNQQQGLANTLQDMTQGGGPNPALAQLNKTTGQNIANTAAAMASSRGAGANPAAMARQVARQGAETQQNAAGQAAGLRAQQQMNAISALQGQQQNMAGVAGAQVGQQANATNAYSTAAQNAQQNLLSGINAQNQNRVAMQSNINNANAGIQNTVAQGQQGLLGGALGAVGSAVGLPFAEGGSVPKIHGTPKLANVYYADGGRTNLPKIDEKASTPEGLTLSSSEGARALQKGMSGLGAGLGKMLHGSKNDSGIPEELPQLQEPKLGDQFGGQAKDVFGRGSPVPSLHSPGSLSTSAPGLQNQEEFNNRINYPEAYQEIPSASEAMKPRAFAKGGKVPAMLSPGEKYLTPRQAQDVLKGKENPMRGKTVPGKAKVDGNDYANDTVPATLEEGGCVIPRSVMQSDKPMQNAIKFVHSHMQKMAKGGKVEHKHSEELPEHEDPQEIEPFKALNAEHQLQILHKPHMIFSAEKPIVKPQINLGHKEVLKLLESRGYPAEEAHGKYGSEEPSIMVHHVQPHHVNHLMKLAKQLGQESAVYSEGGKHEAHILNGPHEGSVAKGEGTQVHEEEPEDYYTKTKNGLVFSHNIDWTKLHRRK